MNHIKLAELSEKLDILEVARHYNLNLVKSGANWKCLSPFGDEDTASCLFSPSKQIFKDFSSGKGGDAITLVEEMEGLEYPDAMRFLGEMYGIELGDDVPQELLTKRSQIQASASILSAYFISLLEQSASAQKYASRFSQEQIKKWALGYCPMTPSADYDRHFKNCGLISENGHNLMRGRLIFPIRSRSGSIISFTGRRIDGGKEYKYINGRETELFVKSNVLYGIFESRSAIVKLDHGILLEGNPDVITSHEYKHENTLCPLGTSFTEGQIKECLRLTKNWTIIYDGDKAGIKATSRVVRLFLDSGVEPKFLPMPENLDPDDYLKEHLKYDFSQSVGGISFLAKDNELDGQFFDTMVNYLESIENPHLKNIKAIELSMNFGLSRQFIEVRETWKKLHDSEEFYSSTSSKNLLDKWQVAQRSL